MDYILILNQKNRAGKPRVVDDGKHSGIIRQQQQGLKKYSIIAMLIC